MFDNFVGPVWTGSGGVCTYYTSTQDRCTFYPATSDPGVAYKLSVDQNYSQIAACSCPEQAEGSPAAAVIAAQCKKPGGDLKAESQVLVWTIIEPSGKEGESSEAPLSLGDYDELKRIFLIRGNLYAAIGTENGTIRARIESDGISWSILTESEHYADTADQTTILPGPDNCVILAGKSGETWLIVNQDTGKIVKSTNVGEFFYDIHDQTSDYFINKYWDSIDGYYMMLHRKKDCSLVNKTRCHSIEIDHTRNRAVLIHSSDSSVTPSPAPNAPGLEVIDLETEHVIFSIPISDVTAISGADALAMLDNRLMLSTGEGIKLVLADTGKNDPGSAEIPNGTSRLTNTIRRSGKNWALLSGTNDSGNYPMVEEYIGIVSKSGSLLWTDIPAYRAV